jgi:hypothetical protein
MVERLASNVEGATLGEVDLRPYIKDPQEEVLKRVGMLRQIER